MRFQHKILASTLACALALAGFGTAAAQEAPPQDAGAFVGVGVGNAHWNTQGRDANRLDYSIFGGQRWDIGHNQSLGWRASATDFGQPTWTVVPGVQAKTRLRTVGIGADYRLRPSGGPVFLEANAGLLHGVERTDVQAFGGASSHANGYQAGARIGYTLARNLDLSVGYDYNRLHFGGSDSHLNLGVVDAAAAWRF